MIYCQLQMLIIDHSLDMFRASLCPSSGEKTTCYCIWSVFAGSVGCGRLRYCGATLRVWSLWRLLLQNYQQIHSICSNTWSFLLKMGIKMPETCWDSVNNQHPQLTINHLYCCILLDFFPHAFVSTFNLQYSGTVQTSVSIGSPRLETKGSGELIRSTR